MSNANINSVGFAKKITGKLGKFKVSWQHKTMAIGDEAQNAHSLDAFKHMV